MTAGGNDAAPGWRPMRQEDVPAVVALADRVHPTLPEGAETFRDRLQLFPAGCLVLSGAGGALVGYAIAHPWRFPEPPELDRVLGSLPDPCDALLVHDLALLPQARGCGAAREAVERLLALGERYGRCMLVSVYGTEPFWRRFGFRPAAPPPKSLLAYGPGAALMTRTGGMPPQDAAGS